MPCGGLNPLPCPCRYFNLVGSPGLMARLIAPLTRAMAFVKRHTNGTLYQVQPDEGCHVQGSIHCYQVQPCTATTHLIPPLITTPLCLLIPGPSLGPRPVQDTTAHIAKALRKDQASTPLSYAMKTRPAPHACHAPPHHTSSLSMPLSETGERRGVPKATNATP